MALTALNGAIIMSDDLLEDFLGEFDFQGANPLAPLTAEEFVMQRLTEGKNARIDVVRYNLKRNFEFRDELRVKGIKFMRQVFDVNSDGLVYKELSNLEYAKAINEEYLLATSGPTFEFAAADGRGKVDMNKLMDLVCAHERVKEIIDKA